MSDNEANAAQRMFDTLYPALEKAQAERDQWQAAATVLETMDIIFGPLLEALMQDDAPQNYVTHAVRLGGSAWEVTFRKFPEGKTPAAHLRELTTEVERLTAEVERLRADAKSMAEDTVAAVLT
jgi:hypothetical protein